MCHHHWLIEHRADPADPDTWTELDEVAIPAGRTIAPDVLDVSRARARALAAMHAAARPDLAAEIVAARYSCCGPEETITAPETSEIDDTRLAAELATARTALRFYADSALWHHNVVPDLASAAVTVTCDALADRGRVAQAALEGRSDA